MEKDRISIIPPPPIFIITSELSWGTTGDSLSVGNAAYTGGNLVPVRFLYFEKNINVEDRDQMRDYSPFRKPSLVFEESRKQPA